MSRPYDYDDGSGRGGARPQPDEVPGGNALVSFLRWTWRQLISMRVALMLLLLLALAAIPGSLVPQRSADPNGVLQFEQDHPTLYPILNAFPIEAFDVYSSVWFSAIYLLLFVSLIGCIVPRIRHHWQAWRSEPPKTPARLQRMAGFVEVRITNPEASEAEKLAYAERAVQEGASLLKRRRYRVVQQTAVRRGVTEISVSAERGYARETGNLLFHIAMVGVLISVAIGGAVSFNGQKVLVEGEAMVNSLIDYDSIDRGTAFDPASLEPFGVRLDSLEVDYMTPDEGNIDAIGLPVDFRANMTLLSPEGKEQGQRLIRVNHPLRVYDAPIYLIQNGYAPKVTIRNAEGDVVFSEATPFIPQDMNMVSLGILKVPHGLGDQQAGFRGFFYPTKADLESGAYTSNFPDLENPLLTLDMFVGDLGINEGIPTSVYELDTSEMEQLTGRAIGEPSLEIRVGETVDLPNGLGTITLESVPRYASFDIMRNPAQAWILVTALVALGSLVLSLFIPRRRMWIKAIPTEEGVVMQYAALARGDDPALEHAVGELRDAHRERL